MLPSFLPLEPTFTANQGLKKFMEFLLKFVNILSNAYYSCTVKLGLRKHVGFLQIRSHISDHQKETTSGSIWTSHTGCFYYLQSCSHGCVQTKIGTDSFPALNQALTLISGCRV